MTIVYFRQKKWSPGDFQRVQKPNFWHFHISSHRGRSVARWLHMQEVLGSNPGPGNVFLVKDLSSSLLWFPGDHKYCQKSRNLSPYLSGSYFSICSKVAKVMCLGFLVFVLYNGINAHEAERREDELDRQMLEIGTTKLNIRNFFFPWGCATFQVHCKKLEIIEKRTCGFSRIRTPDLQHISLLSMP